MALRIRYAILGTVYEWRFQDVIPTSSEDVVSAGIPENPILGQNFPNPFSSSTTIRFAIPEPAHTRLVVYDLLGREVETLVDALLPMGQHTTTFEAHDLPSGIYLYRLDTSEARAVRKMLLLQ